MLLVPHDDLGSLRFTTSRLAGDDDASVFPCPLHGLVGGLCDGEDVWHAFEYFAALSDDSFLMGMTTWA